MSDAVNSVVIHYPKPEKIQEFRDLVLRVKNTFKHFPGNPYHHAFEVGTGEDVEIVIFEKHKDQDSLNRIHESSEFKEIIELAGQLIRQPPRLIQGAPLPGFEGSSKTAAAAFLVDSQWV
ncbi:hypothetical protein BJY01DRAFT_213786 [Aspergillus pseudoustus]|uniref:ABM domain-containing protein n=1 Tax=Aspergillus pseudoustus TaxID=1810923 RepID=A0ABR4K0T7_9EURO